MAPKHRVGAGALVAVALLVLASCGRASDATTSTRPGRVPTTVTVPATTSTQAVNAATSGPIPPLAPPAPGWSQSLTALPPGGGFTGLSCISDTFCIAVGGGSSGYGAALTAGSGVSMSWDGAAWSGPSVYFPAPTTGAVTAPVMPAVSCTSGPTCVIVDGSDHASTGDGTTWSAPTVLATAPPPGANPFDPGAGHPGARTVSVACPTPKLCAAVDNTGQVFTQRNGAWVGPRAFGTPSPSGASVALYQQGRVGLSCPSATSCTGVVGTFVLGWDGRVWTLEGAPWTASLPPNASGTPDATAISCPSATLCAIVSGSGVSYRNGTAAWAPVKTIDPQGDLDGISCPTTSFCMAVDTGGSVVTWNGSVWSTPVTAIPAARIYTGVGTSVACTSPKFCMVMNADGDYATYTGT